MLKNKVCVYVDNVSTVALVDTGAAVSIMSLAFKDRLGQKYCLLGTGTLPFAVLVENCCAQLVFVVYRSP